MRLQQTLTRWAPHPKAMPHRSQLCGVSDIHLVAKEIGYSKFA